MDKSLDQILGSHACSEKYLRKYFPEFMNELDVRWPMLPFKEKIYLYMHNIPQPPVCPICGGPLTLINTGAGYHHYCSTKCAHTEIAEKTRKTKEERYGDPNYNNTKKIRATKKERYGDETFTNIQKTRATKKERYGDETFTNIQKTRETKLAKYGDEYFNNKEKANSTKISRYGSTSYNNRDQAEKTCQEKYGCSNPFQVEEFKETARKTMRERYGTDYSHQSPIVQEKIRQNSMKKWGVDYPVQAQAVKEKIMESNRKNVINRTPGLIDYTDDGDWIMDCPHKGECDQCTAHQYIITPINFFARREFSIEPCTTLKPVAPLSNKNTSLEQFVTKILTDNGIEFITNDRTVLDGLEIDIYIPDKMIGIECNGCFWHSDEVKPMNYHYEKWLKCRQKGVQLLTVWEDQIINKPEIVKSIILSKCGVSERKIYARECEVKDVTPTECSNFLKENHLQGSTPSVVKKGLCYDGELVGVMTWGKRGVLSGGKKKGGDEWELSRFCVKKGVRITGGFSKLLSHFVEEYHPGSIVSFASNDISDGHVYKENGFVEGESTLSYWYVSKKDRTRYHRSSFTKSRLKAMGYDIEGKTEKEIMSNLPYYRIYDSGHTKFTRSF